jgi:hypothetical protein
MMQVPAVGVSVGGKFAYKKKAASHERCEAA